MKHEFDNYDRYCLWANQIPIKAKKDFIARQPMERLGTAQEIADFAIYLASEESTFTTGNAFAVDGGMTI